MGEKKKNELNKMINSTILSLNIFSLLSVSPLYTLYNFHQGYLKSTFFACHFSKSLSNIIFSSTNHHQTTIKKSSFSHIINNAIYFNNDDLTEYCVFIISNGSFFQPGTIIHDQIIMPNQYENIAIDHYNSRPYFINDICGDIIIIDCIFDGCYAQTNSGGSLCIEQEANVI